MTATHSDELVGRLVVEGRYRVERALDAGGMGAVFVGVRVSDGAPVAIKALHPMLAKERQHVDRFRRECLVTARLEHPHIVAVIEATGASADEPPLLVMELLEGEPLHRRIGARGPVPPEEAVPIARQVLAALSAAHGIGIVHRDLKPSNVVLLGGHRAMPFVKVIDFGVAGLMDSDGYQRLTRTGQVVGTPAYMAPEQALGRAVGERADVYAAGAILYAALSGRHPYQGPMHEVLPRLVEGDRPRLGDVTTGLDPRLLDIVETAMSFSQEDRFASAAAFEGALASIDARVVETMVDWEPPVPLETLRREVVRWQPTAPGIARGLEAGGSVAAPKVPRPRAGLRRALAVALAAATFFALSLGVLVVGMRMFESRPVVSDADVAPVAPVVPVAPVGWIPGSSPAEVEPGDPAPAGEDARPRPQIAPAPRERASRGKGPRARRPAAMAPPAENPASGDQGDGPESSAEVVGYLRSRPRRADVRVNGQDGVLLSRATAAVRGRFADFRRCVDDGGGGPMFMASISGVVDTDGVMSQSHIGGSDAVARRCLRARVPRRWPPETRGRPIALVVVAILN